LAALFVEFAQVGCEKKPKGKYPDFLTPAFRAC
jgi:hypothetical protein